jgi:hypothetical protein
LPLHYVSVLSIARAWERALDCFAISMIIGGTRLVLILQVGDGWLVKGRA